MKSSKYSFFCISTHLGGAERSLIAFLAHLKETQVTIEVVTPKSQGPLIDELTRLGIKSITVDMPNDLLQTSRQKGLVTKMLNPLFYKKLAAQFKEIRQYITDSKPTCIHSTGLKYHCILGLLALTGEKTPIVIHLRDILSKRSLRIFFKLVAKKRNVKFVANSKATADCIKPVKSEIIYNSFDSDHFCKGASEIKKTYGLPENKLLVGTMGAIARWKGQREFISMAKLLQNNDNLHFVIAGEEIYDTEGDRGELAFLKTQVKKNGLNARFSFLPFQKDPRQFYNGIDVFVHSSIQPEPFGRVIVEAQLCETPVTAANRGGPLEIIENGESGLLHTMGSAQSMAANVQKLTYDQNYRKNMGQKARQQALKFAKSNPFHQLRDAIKRSELS